MNRPFRQILFAFRDHLRDHLNLIFTLSFIWALIFILIPNKGHALQEELVEKKYDYLLKFRDKYSKSEFIKTHNSKLHSRFYKGTQNRLLLFFPGFTEPEVKYVETIYDIRKKYGGDIAVIDIRDQGLSFRTNKEKKHPHLIHIDSFEDYYSDFKYIFNHFYYKKKYEDIDIIAFSVSGYITVRSLVKYPKIRKKISTYFSIAPMLRINYPKYTPANFLLGVTNLLYKKNEFPPFSTPYKDETVSSSKVSQSANRLWFKNKLAKDHPKSIRSAPTYHWIKQALMDRINFRSRELSALKDVDIYLYSASKDSIVSVSEHKKLCPIMGNCKLINVKGAKHEIFAEKDVYRDPVIKHILENL